MKKNLQISCDFLRKESQHVAEYKKKRLLVLGVLVLCLMVLIACSGEEIAHSRTVFAMDTVMTLQAYGPKGEKAQDRLESELYRMDADWSKTRSASFTARMNSDPGSPVPVDPEEMEMLTSARKYAQETSGAFDVTAAGLSSLWGFSSGAYRVPEEKEIRETLKGVGMEHLHVRDDAAWVDPGTAVDLGGIAKGLAAEKAREIYQKTGIQHGFANLGGDVMLFGGRPDHTPWRVALQDPLFPDDSLGTLTLNDGYVMTSGDYQRYFEEDGVRYHHILDPKTGRPAQSGLHSVSIIADAQEGNGRMCDALATALFVMGKDAAVDYWRAHADEFQMVLVTSSGDVVVSEGLRGRFSPEKTGRWNVDYVA